jgi:RNA polymerase sigma-70 factor (ECF subfamily)
MEPTDKDLMLAVSAGDVKQFGVLFDRYHQRLFDFFYRLSGDSASSHDLVQEVFLRMLKYRHRFGPDSEFRAWMYQIARTARIDRFRGEHKASVRPESSQEGSPGPDRLAELEERSRLLQRALRELLILARFQEMKYGQIAVVLDIEVGAVKVRIHRTIAELRDIFLQLSGDVLPGRAAIQASCRYSRSICSDHPFTHSNPPWSRDELENWETAAFKRNCSLSPFLNPSGRR